MANKELAALAAEIEQTTALNASLQQEILREQAKMETLILDQKAKEKALEPKLVKVALAEERVGKYEDLIYFLNGEIDHFTAETEEKVNPEIASLLDQNEQLRCEYESVGAEILALD